MNPTRSEDEPERARGWQERADGADIPWRQIRRGLAWPAGMARLQGLRHFAHCAVSPGIPPFPTGVHSMATASMSVSIRSACSVTCISIDQKGL